MRLFLFVMLLTLIGAAPARAQTERARDSLRGLRGVFVALEKIDPEAERAGLTKDSIQTAVELHLRKAGIQLFNATDYYAREDVALLSVSFTFLNTYKSSDTFTYMLEVSLEQSVRLMRDPNIMIIVPTWSRSLVGTIGTSRARELRSTVEDKIDDFANDYLAANPKR